MFFRFHTNHKKIHTNHFYLSIFGNSLADLFRSLQNPLLIRFVIQPRVHRLLQLFPATLRYKIPFDKPRPCFRTFRFLDIIVNNLLSLFCFSFCPYVSTRFSFLLYRRLVFQLCVVIKKNYKL